MQRFWLCALSLAFTPLHALDWGEDHPHLRKFRERCRQVRTHVRLDPENLPREGELGFFPLGAFESAQARFSYLRALDTAAEARRSFRRETIVTKKKKKKVIYIPPADNHRAAFGLDRPALAVLYRGRLFLNDGNHKVIASHLLKASTMPAEIIKVWDDDVDFETFRAGMEALNLGHWRDYQGTMMPFLDLCDLVNDPNLFLARLEIWRLTVDFEDGVPVIRKSKGAKRASALKINQQAMVENYWADALHRAERRWSDALGPDDLSLSDQKRDLRIVRSAALDENSPLKDILFLEKPKKHPDLFTLVSAHVAQHGCEKFLRHGVSE